MVSVYQLSKMNFTGKYTFESDENYEQFMKALGVPDDAIEHGKTLKFDTEIVQNGNEFTWSQIYPCHTTTNKFIVGQESEIETLNCDKVKVTVHQDGGKLLMNFPKYIHTATIEGGKLVENSVCDGITLKRFHKKTV
ncbi:gastrotropin-like isoform X1 [Chiloscyllium plagiosum]|uniref:gastrotropin-like isoform X1 n=1 Tax=Chiloscyllium plagiosum TaxID=36176 RepID=UPI001CB7E468|nr:gastrotropin-like isoform X1 [Chiloscyllium plagiosum]